SATMRIAALAGIGIFATGGVGGVHRGAEATFDISADLTELGQTGTTVVCAGVKSILDIAKTLEYLETQRVPVIAYQSDDFPAFYTRSSGLKADHRLDTPEDIAQAMLLHEQIGSGTGILVANPIPEVDALDPAFIDGTITAAVAEAEGRGIGRKELTPFLLARINELSQGRSLKANIALVRNNAALAARIAVAYAGLKPMGR
ncbi:MAG: pseudouridine-5'-phosphate glycosidase, partial [Mesorhizobium sp.]